MCLIAFAYKTHPKYRLILIANRDEFYDRPTRSAQYWKDEGHPDIIGGKDLEAGGMWMGIHSDGRFSALTNYRDPSIQRTDPPSRGDIVLKYLTSTVGPHQYLKALNANADLYNGFNVLSGDDQDLFHYSNITNSITPIEPGVHGVSNALLNTSWPKLDKTKERLKECLSTGFTTQDLFSILSDSEQAPEEDLPSTGIPLELEQAISPVFIKTDNYGTRSSTVLLIHMNGTIEFVERKFDLHDPSEYSEISFNL